MRSPRPAARIRARRCRRVSAVGGSPCIGMGIIGAALKIRRSRPLPPSSSRQGMSVNRTRDTSLMANAIRALAMDAVQQANSGHPGAPMGMAEIAVALWSRHLRHNPGNPHWANRDRFVLSNGHASMILYALLHLTGYDLPMSELRN